MNGRKARELRKQALKLCDPDKGLMLGKVSKTVKGRDGKPVKIKMGVLFWHGMSKRGIYQALKRAA